MAASQNFTVATTPVLLATGPLSVIVQNLGPNFVFLGGSNVTASNGLELAPDTRASEMQSPITLGKHEELFCLAYAGVSDVRVLLFG